MNWNKHIWAFVCVLLSVFFYSCEKQNYDSSAQDYGLLKVTIANAEQVEHVLLIPGIDTLSFEGSEVSVDSIPAGSHRVVLYSKSEGFFFDGTVASCVTTQSDLYVSSTLCTIRPSKVNEISLPLKKLSRVVSVKLLNAESIAAASVYLGNVASAVDVEFNRLMDSQSLILPLKYSDNEYEKQEKVLGFIGDNFEMRLELSGESEKALQVSAALSELRYNPNDTSEIQVSIDMSSRPLVAGFSIGDQKYTVDVRESYRVGDYYPNPMVDTNDPTAVSKIEGIVLEVASDGFHGKMLSLQEGTSLAWNTSGAADNTDDEDDGMANFSKIKAKDPSFTSYPAFEWCASLGTGWYIPAVNEVKLIRSVWQQNKALFNDRFTAIGATPLSATKYVSSKEKDQAAYYYSSTEYSEARNKILSLNFNGTSEPVSGVKKSSGTAENLLFRAVKSF